MLTYSSPITFSTIFIPKLCSKESPNSQIILEFLKKNEILNKKYVF